MDTIKIEGNLVFMDPIAKEKFKEASERKDVELDFSDVESMDSCGLDLIVKLYKQLLSKGGSLKITKVKKNVMDVCKQIGINRVIDINPEE